MFLFLTLILFYNILKNSNKRNCSNSIDLNKISESYHLFAGVKAVSQTRKYKKSNSRRKQNLKMNENPNLRKNKRLGKTLKKYKKMNYADIETESSEESSKGEYEIPNELVYQYPMAYTPFYPLAYQNYMQYPQGNFPATMEDNLDNDEEFDSLSNEGSDSEDGYDELTDESFGEKDKYSFQDKYDNAYKEKEATGEESSSKTGDYYISSKIRIGDDSIQGPYEASEESEIYTPILDDINKSKELLNPNADHQTQIDPYIIDILKKNEGKFEQVAVTSDKDHSDGPIMVKEIISFGETKNNKPDSKFQNEALLALSQNFVAEKLENIKKEDEELADEVNENIDELKEKVEVSERELKTKMLEDDLDSIEKNGEKLGLTEEEIKAEKEQYEKLVEELMVKDASPADPPEDKKTKKNS